MAIETRNGRGRYYYRKRRIGRRVVSEYIASGPLVGLAAHVADQNQADREEQRAALQAERHWQKELDAQVDGACAIIRATVAQALEAAGFHRHKGQWRKRHAQHPN